MSAKTIPILPDELDKLPDERKDTKDFRFHKKPRREVDDKVCTSLKSMIEKYSDDADQLSKQMNGVDGQIEGENGINEKIDGMKTAITLLKEYIAKKV